MTVSTPPPGAPVRSRDDARRRRPLALPSVVPGEPRIRGVRHAHPHRADAAAQRPDRDRGRGRTQPVRNRPVAVAPRSHRHAGRPHARARRVHDRARHHLRGSRPLRRDRRPAGRRAGRYSSCGRRGPWLRADVRRAARTIDRVRAAPAAPRGDSARRGPGGRSVLPGHWRDLQPADPDGSGRRLRVPERCARSRRPSASRAAAAGARRPCPPRPRAGDRRRGDQDARRRPSRHQRERRVAAPRQPDRAARRQEQSAAALSGRQTHLPLRVGRRRAERPDAAPAPSRTRSSSLERPPSARARSWRRPSIRCLPASKCRPRWRTTCCSRTSFTVPSTGRWPRHRPSWGSGSSRRCSSGGSVSPGAGSAWRSASRACGAARSG